MQITVTKRLVFLLLCSLVAIIAIGGVGIVQMQRIKTQLDRVQARYVPAMQAVAAAALAFSDVRRASVLYTNAGSDNVRSIARKQLSDGTNALNDRLEAVQRAAIGLDAEKQYIDQEKTVAARYLEMTHKLIADMEAPGTDIAALLASAPKTLGPVGGELLKTLTEHGQLYNGTMQRSVEESEHLYAAARWEILLCALAALGIMLLVGVILIREIRMRLNRMATFMDNVSQSLDFTQHLPVLRQDELGKTAAAFNRLVQRMQQNLGTLAESARSVTHSANEMAETSDQVAIAANHQSEAAASMAATLEEVTVSINLVGERSVDTDRVVSEVGAFSLAGEKAIGEVSTEMRNISASVDNAAEQIRHLESSSVEIGNVVKVIREVAEQTNLLALNAAIEAARAGETGRGFAVVADEVRKLAERTAQSTTEITRTVDAMRNGAAGAVRTMEDVVSKVAVGVARADEANEEISKISQSSHEAVSMVGDISQSIREQGAASNNIASQVERIAQMAEESSAGAANNAEIAKNLDQLARSMHSVIDNYKLG